MERVVLDHKHKGGRTMAKVKFDCGHYEDIEGTPTELKRWRREGRFTECWDCGLGLPGARESIKATEAIIEAARAQKQQPA